MVFLIVIFPFGLDNYMILYVCGIEMDIGGNPRGKGGKPMVSPGKMIYTWLVFHIFFLYLQEGIMLQSILGDTTETQQ